jgi:hypothetical protein
MTTIASKEINMNAITWLRKTSGKIAEAVFFITSLDCSNEDVNVFSENNNTSPVEMIIPTSKTIQNFKMNLD